MNIVERDLKAHRIQLIDHEIAFCECHFISRLFIKRFLLCVFSKFSSEVFIVLVVFYLGFWEFSIVKMFRKLRRKK